MRSEGLRCARDGGWQFIVDVGNVDTVRLRNVDAFGRRRREYVSLVDDASNPFDVMDFMLMEREVVDLRLIVEVFLNSCSCRL